MKHRRFKIEVIPASSSSKADLLTFPGSFLKAL
jgi:hypothetical protein